MSETTSSTAAAEWKTGWTLVLAASMGFSFFSLLLAAMGLFIEPLTKEFGWTRTLLSSGPSIAVTITAILSPPFGILIDRFGSRRLVLPGLIITIAATCAFSLIDGSQTQWYILWAIFGVVAVTIKSTAWTAGVLGCFSQARGLALGLTLSGTAVAQMVVPPLTNWLIDGFGWRGAFIGLGLGWGGLTFILCLLFFFDAHDRAKAKKKANIVQDEGAKVALTGLTPGQALRDSALWRVGISNFVVMVLTIGLMLHIFPILTEAGVSRTHAAWLASLSGLAGIIGKLVTGFLLDRYRPNWIGGITLAIMSLAFLLLMDGIRSPALIICAMIVNGYAFGTKTQITGFLTAGYGGLKHFGVIYGVMGALMALASGLGPMTAGIIYDQAGGYGPFLLAGAIGCALGGVLMMTLPAYPVWTKKEEGAVA
ncbi:MFS transporter [Sphingobium sufflavum]|uniref:MFS transporter n=1 Tax=Sphingobium sufflavum TaxID=1129547 RepID=UPI001F35D478|nr:MFS transporter [Sphingobium sufflavum]MCE7797153.1 MFS transporter [Sphingobium sufflavum]